MAGTVLVYRLNHTEGRYTQYARNYGRSKSRWFAREVYLTGSLAVRSRSRWRKLQELTVRRMFEGVDLDNAPSVIPFRNHELLRQTLAVRLPKEGMTLKEAAAKVALCLEHTDSKGWKVASGMGRQLTTAMKGLTAHL